MKSHCEIGIKHNTKLLVYFIRDQNGRVSYYSDRSSATDLSLCGVPNRMVTDLRRSEGHAAIGNQAYRDARYGLKCTNVLVIVSRRQSLNFTRAMSYSNVLFVAELEALETRCKNISKSFFQDICEPNYCLYHIIQPAQDTSVTTRLRRTISFSRSVHLHTKNTVHL